MPWWQIVALCLLLLAGFYAGLDWLLAKFRKDKKLKFWPWKQIQAWYQKGPDDDELDKEWAELSTAEESGLEKTPEPHPVEISNNLRHV